MHLDNQEFSRVATVGRKSSLLRLIRAYFISLNCEIGWARKKFFIALRQNLYTLEPFVAGWSSLVARQAHNLKVAGSNPAPAPKIYNPQHYPKENYFSRRHVRGGL